MGSSQRKMTFAVVGDTHVPDRVGELHPQLVSMLQDIHPDKIFHTGDISQEAVLGQLTAIAPVIAVRGNRDWRWKKPLPMEIELEVNGVKLVLLHGHGGWGHYLVDKTDNTLRGYRLDRYRKYLSRKYPEANGYIFGHSHFPENTTLDGKLYFNPGSACLGGVPGIPPSFGVLSISGSGEVIGRIRPLEGYRIESGKWVLSNTPDLVLDQ
jgi:putative phosphoesterase